MSKQSHDQDEPQQAPGTSASAAAAQNDTSSSGAESSTADAPDTRSADASGMGETNKTSARGRPRGRRGGKGRTSNTRDSASTGAQHDDASQQASDPAASKSADSGAADAKSSDSSSSQSSNSSEAKSPDSMSSESKSPDSKASTSKTSSDKNTGASADAKASTGTSSASAAASKPESSKPSSSKPSTSKASPSPSASTAGGTGGTGQGGSATAASGRGGGGRQTIGTVALVLVILLAVGVVVAGWFGWQRLEQQQQRLAQVDSNREAVSALESRLSEAEQARASVDDAVASVESEFSDYRSQVNDTLDRVLDELNSQQQTDEREWLHAEVAYLLRLANQRLQLERDVGGAMALLETADKRLKEADNPALLPVRRAVADELAKLDAVPDVDRTGLYLTLNAQQEQLASLPLKQDVAEIAAEGSIETPPSGDWQQQLKRFGSELKDLVTVRRHDQALEALITPEQETYLRQNVRLVIEQAQLALLKEEPELYRASLDKAVTLIEGYYDTDRDSVKTSIARLTDMRGKTIRPELPDISGSQQAMAHFIQTRFDAGAQGGDA
ncbi:uroporphyrin-3 C-methyltransferase [Onishia taeanensis]|uniref:Uroporphyrin-3 C-methyltransferase n=1 Tax=Onishia taeanensis TaxID=284577 RepID=A0A328XRC6_9GAMM|nr:uroporphyrinogen-III C-methyltransferase [Halomonas taeanensis]RAR58583.1 uroporphyrin-3 C-methyltransferase [Halomonas taeanensis]